MMEVYNSQCLWTRQAMEYVTFARYCSVTGPLLAGGSDMAVQRPGCCFKRYS